MSKKTRFQTRAIHAGNEPDKETGAVVAPIHLTSTYQQEGVGLNKGFDYSRGGNPTRQRLEENIAALEEGQFGNIFFQTLAGRIASSGVVKPLIKTHTFLLVRGCKMNRCHNGPGFLIRLISGVDCTGLEPGYLTHCQTCVYPLFK
jgi:cystathionine beta-lyase/cystathionine gamma-synthase